jgi:hypothetical protein
MIVDGVRVLALSFQLILDLQLIWFQDNSPVMGYAAGGIPQMRCPKGNRILRLGPFDGCDSRLVSNAE